MKLAKGHPHYQNYYYTKNAILFRVSPLQLRDPFKNLPLKNPICIDLTYPSFIVSTQHYFVKHYI